MNHQWVSPESLYLTTLRPDTQRRSQPTPHHRLRLHRSGRSEVMQQRAAPSAILGVAGRLPQKLHNQRSPERGKSVRVQWVGDMLFRDEYKVQRSRQLSKQFKSDLPFSTFGLSKLNKERSQNLSAQVLPPREQGAEHSLSPSSARSFAVESFRPSLSPRTCISPPDGETP